jgi:long-chain acyl-CoA synthetase
VEDLVSNRRVMQLFEERIRQVNEKLPPYETIKKFAILPRDFSIEGGELTPTLKLKRKVIYEKYRERIEGLFLDNANGANGQEKIQNGGKR